MNVKKGICLSVFLIAIINSCVAQDVSTIFTADSLASGNVKDVLTNFYQLASNNLTGPNKEFNFSSNPFAIMLKNNPGLAVDTEYYKYKYLRKLNFNFGVKMDPSNQFNGFSVGTKYALINQRDTTTSALLFMKLGEDPLSKERNILNKSLGEYASGAFSKDSLGEAEEMSFFSKENMLFQNDKMAFNKFDTSFQRIVIAVAEKEKLTNILKIINDNPCSNISAESEKIFDKLKNSIKNSLLWTVGVSDTTYKDALFFSNILFYSELSKGVFQQKRGSNIELDIKSSLNLVDDTLTLSHNLRRSIFNFEPGLNWVIRNKANDQSFFELKFSGSYGHNFSALYTDEQRDVITINTTFRVRVMADTWIPITLKYDTNTGTVFGFFNITMNFTGLKELIKGK